MSHSFNSPTPTTNSSNTAGLAGFLITLLSCGFLAPIGLIVSLIGLRKSPRIFAVLGTLLGVLGLGGYLVVGAMIYGGQRVVAFALTDEAIKKGVAEINEYREQNNGQLPDDIDGMKLLVDNKDSWGQSLRYDRDGNSFKVRSAGRDQKFDTEDDMFSQDYSAEEAVVLDVGTGGDSDGPVMIEGDDSGPVVIPPPEKEAEKEETEEQDE